MDPKYIGTVYANGAEHKLFWPGPGTDICSADGTATETGIYDTYAHAVYDAHCAWNDWTDDPNTDLRQCFLRAGGASEDAPRRPGTRSRATSR